MINKKAKNWVSKNCKFAMELPPSNQADQDPLAPPAPNPLEAEQFAQAETKFGQSLNSFKVVAKQEDSEVESIEEDRFDPGSQYGHYTETTGAYNQHYLDIVLKGNVYYPDILANSPMYGPFAESILLSFNEDPPDIIYQEIKRWEEIQSEFKIVSMQRTGDFYDVTISCSLSGQSPYEEPEREYDPDDYDRGRF